MIQQIAHFVIKHWALVGAFVLVLIVIILEEAKSQAAKGEKVTPSMATHLINRENAIVVDLRDAASFREGHIINAKNIAVVDFERQKDKLNPFRNQPVILVDAMGLKTAPIVTLLKTAGFTRVITLKGGIDAWKAAGMPVVQ